MKFLKYLFKKQTSYKHDFPALKEDVKQLCDSEAWKSPNGLVVLPEFSEGNPTW